MKSKLTTLIPSTETRRTHQLRNAQYQPDKFQTYNDWFYFIHVDPVIRWWHAIGMLMGVGLYLWALSDLYFGLGIHTVIKTLLGVFFFYILPFLSHNLYDGGSAKLAPDKVGSTFLPVIHINLLTLTGRYDQWLREFIKKYPFTVEAWQLEEKSSSLK